VTPPVYDRLLSFLGELDAKRIACTLDHVRSEAAMVSVAVPGERWQVELLDDGSVDVERFVSTGQFCGEPALNELFAKDAGSGHRESLTAGTPLRQPRSVYGVFHP